MITLEQPSIALNDSHHNHLTVRMWNTARVTDDYSSQDVINWVVSIANRAPGGRLKNVVFACHGRPGAVQMGRDLFDRNNVALFSAWAGKVEKIWFRSCEVAGVINGRPDRDGNAFCSQVARNANCYVVAATVVQWTRPSMGEVVLHDSHHTLPYGQIDSFEGRVLSYGPDGNVTWSHTYREGNEANNE